MYLWLPGVHIPIAGLSTLTWLTSSFNQHCTFGKNILERLGEVERLLKNHCSSGTEIECEPRYCQWQAPCAVMPASQGGVNGFSASCVSQHRLWPLGFHRVISYGECLPSHMELGNSQII